MRPIFLLTLFSCLISLFLVGCTRGSSEQRNSIRVQLVNEPISLDPLLAEDGVALQVLNNLGQGLVGYDGEGKLQNRIAEKYTVSSDQKSYEFFLRKNAKWSDGRPVTASDFITAFKRMLSPSSLCKLIPFFMPIRGAQAFHQGKMDFQKVGIRDFDNRLIIELEKPVPFFIHALALPSAFPIRQDLLDANHGSWPEMAPATGPYRMVQHQINQKIILEKNPHFWGHPAAISRVEFRIIVDEATALNLFDRGDLDILTRVPSHDFPRLRKQGRLHFDPIFASYYLSFNCRKPPFNDKNWRKAVAGSIRRNEVAALLEGAGLPAWSWIPKGLEGYLPYQDPSIVFAEALRWGRNQAHPLMAALFDTGARNASIMEKVQSDLHEELKIIIKLDNLDWKAYIQKIRSDPPSLFRFGWLAPFADPISHLQVFTTDNLNNLSGCSNSKYDALVQEIEGMTPGAIREAKILQAQKILLEEEASVVPLYHYVQCTAVSERVRGFRINPFGVIFAEELNISSNTSLKGGAPEGR